MSEHNLRICEMIFKQKEDHLRWYDAYNVFFDYFRKIALEGKSSVREFININSELEYFDFATYAISEDNDTKKGIRNCVKIIGTDIIKELSILEESNFEKLGELNETIKITQNQQIDLIKSLALYQQTEQKLFDELKNEYLN